MTTILVDSDYLSDTDLANNVAAANLILSKWGAYWSIKPVVTTDPTQPFDMVAHITDANRHAGAYGYHTVESEIKLYHGNGVHSTAPAPTQLPPGGEPTSYISPSALLHNVYGTYTAPHWLRAIWNFARTKIIRAPKQTSPARYREGILTVLLHELMEMLADSHIDKYSKPDSQGREWIIEVCDHTSGQYSTSTVNGKVCIIPNATLPSYYDLQGKAPYDLLRLLKTPFDRSAKSFYGYYKGANGAFTKL